MALANVACLLARRQAAKEGRGVLAVDWDLDAPGLHRFFRNRFTRCFGTGANHETDFDGYPGLIDFFWELKSAIRDVAVPNAQGVRAVIDSVKLQRFIVESDIPSLDFLKAGRFGDDYSGRVSTFKWDSLFDRAPGIFEILAEQIASQYEYVLIDSRTGFNDISGICTALLPDKLVVVFTPNRQSPAGALDLIRRATNYRSQSEDLRPLTVFPLPSRIDSSERERDLAWRYGNKVTDIPGYQPQFEDLFKDVYGLSECSLSKYFDDVRLLQLSPFAYGEELAVDPERERETAGSLLLHSYRNLTTRLVEQSAPWEDQGADAVRTQSLAEAERAEAAVAALIPAEQESARRALTRLVRVAPPEEGGQVTLVGINPSDLSPSDRMTVDTLLERGLLVREGKGGDASVRVAQQDLVKAWPRLRRWIEQDRDFLLFRQRVRDRLSEWRLTKDDPGTLLQGALLAEAERWLREREGDLTESQQDYIRASGRYAPPTGVRGVGTVQRVFLSTTCLDLVDLRSGLKESLEDMGYQVWASEFPDFPVDSSLDAQDNCLRNVERADQYVLIVNGRYGAAYTGKAYPIHPLPEDPERRISVTWYEYLQALKYGKAIRVLVREEIWNQRRIFQATRKSGADLKETGLPPELFDFLDFVCTREKANWISHFRGVGTMGHGNQPAAAE
jgi:hypothetical protein